MKLSRFFIVTIIGLSLMFSGVAEAALSAYNVFVQNNYPFNKAVLTLNQFSPNVPDFYCPKPFPNIGTGSSASFTYSDQCNTSLKSKWSDSSLPSVSYTLSDNKGDLLTCTLSYGYVSTPPDHCLASVTTKSTSSSNWAQCNVSSSYSSAKNACEVSLIFLPK